MPRLGTLDSLPPDQQALILEWLRNHSLKRVLDQIRAAPPLGLGLAIHRTSLQRYKQRRLRGTPADLLAVAGSFGLTDRQTSRLARRALFALRETLAETAASGPLNQIQPLHSLCCALEKAANLNL